MATPRTVCARCRRPAAACYCAELTPIATRTRVVFLQHPRERRVAVGTCRMAHLALPNSELHVGVCFDRNARVQTLAAQPPGAVAVLFPEAGRDDAGERPHTVIVLDGTWSEARKLLSRNPALARLPRIALEPSHPGTYRIRAAPAPHHLSTVEAVAAVLGRLEDDPARFAPLLRAFDAMVERQLAHAARRPYWHVRKRRRHAGRTTA